MNTFEIEKNQLKTSIRFLKRQLNDVEKRVNALPANLTPEEPVTKKTYPLGFDPDGEWLAEMSGDTGKYRPVKRTNQIKWLYARMGNVFYTEEEAARRSGGLNAHMDLVIAIHDGNHLYPDNGEYLAITIHKTFGVGYGENHSHAPLSLRISGEKSFGYVFEKLGEASIKLAFKWGM